ncbi:hypothetical protein BGZ82_005574 [Podila clonocystis]|nr:hypothetical protein BGZ82_005574 [Podila clonocystis]
MKLLHLAILPALLAQLHTSLADTVLGGIVDYLPKCYAVPDAKLFIEYNSGHCYRRPGANTYQNECSCDIMDSSQRGKLASQGDGCVWVLKVDEYKASNNKVSDIVNNSANKVAKANNAHNIPQALDLLYSRYHGGPHSGDSNAPVVQGIDITNKATRYLGISMWKGIKMIRFHYLKIGQREGWSQGVQLRFTDDLKKRLSKRDLGNENFISFFPEHGMIHSGYEVIIDTHCFYVTALIPFERRSANQHFLNCLKLQESRKVVLKESDIYDGTKSVSEIMNCEQGTNLDNIHDAPKNILMEGLKHILSLGASFIPVVGPFLSIGLDVTFSIIENKSKFDEIMQGAGASTGDEVFKLLVNIGSKSIKKI